MKRWVAALVAVLFLSTATLHIFAHHGDVDDGCAVCHVQSSSLPAATAPVVAVASVVVVTLSDVAVPFVDPARPAAAAARAPPVLPA